MTPVPRHQVPIHVYGKTNWKEIFNSDAHAFWGTGNVNNNHVKGVSVDGTNEWQVLYLDLPPLAAIVFK
jgi:1,4-alpha-glucan branching enzyme